MLLFTVGFFFDFPMPETINVARFVRKLNEVSNVYSRGCSTNGCGQNGKKSGQCKFHAIFQGLCRAPEDSEVTQILCGVVPSETLIDYFLLLLLNGGMMDIDGMVYCDRPYVFHENN